MSLSIMVFAQSDVPESFENSKLWLALEKAPGRETSPVSRRVSSMGNIARFGAPEWLALSSCGDQFSHRLVLLIPSFRTANDSPTKPEHLNISQEGSSIRSSKNMTTLSPTSYPIAWRISAFTGSLCVPSPRAINELRKGCPSTLPLTFTNPRVPKNSTELGQTT